jgi:hypothetical protein
MAEDGQTSPWGKWLEGPPIQVDKRNLNGVASWKMKTAVDPTSCFAEPYLANVSACSEALRSHTVVRTPEPYSHVRDRYFAHLYSHTKPHRIYKTP